MHLIQPTSSGNGFNSSESRDRFVTIETSVISKDTGKLMPIYLEDKKMANRLAQTGFLFGA